MSNKIIKIGNKEVGEGKPVLVVAEISCNHLQDFERAKELVKTACEIGVGAVKLQHYTPATMTLKSDKDYFKIKNHPLWKGKTLYELYETAYMPWEWYEPLSELAGKYNVPVFSTVYDDTAVDFLEKYNCPAYKIGGFEGTDYELLKRVAKTKKPVILSSGMSTKEELEKAVNVLRENGCNDIVIVKAVNAYPTVDLSEMNLRTIPALEKEFDVISGLSEHSITLNVSLLAVTLGAKVIERHFTLKRSDGGADSAFSLETEEMAQLVRDIKDRKNVQEDENILGSVFYGVTKAEQESIIFKRSLWVIKPIKKGEEFTKENIGRFRPNNGLAIKDLPNVLGKKAKQDIDFAVPLSWDLVEE
ncbi:MAG: pseudaminic acid synthase [Parcubacteria group bacterium]|nr:pseudaminic acid synthase [Parcubacteria group bacterium]